MGDGLTTEGFPLGPGVKFSSLSFSSITAFLTPSSPRHGLQEDLEQTEADICLCLEGQGSRLDPQRARSHIITSSGQHSENGHHHVKQVFQDPRRNIPSNDGEERSIDSRSLSEESSDQISGRVGGDPKTIVLPQVTEDIVTQQEQTSEDEELKVSAKCFIVQDKTQLIQSLRANNSAYSKPKFQSYTLSKSSVREEIFCESNTIDSKPENVTDSHYDSDTFSTDSESNDDEEDLNQNKSKFIDGSSFLDQNACVDTDTQEVRMPNGQDTRNRGLRCRSSSPQKRRTKSSTRTRAQGSKSGKHRDKSAVVKCQRKEEDQCTLTLEAKVQKIDFPSGPNDIWLDTCQSKILQFYEAILQEKEIYLYALKASSQLQACTVEDISIGSLCVRLRIRSVDHLDDLSKLAAGSEFSTLFNDIFITPTTLQELGVDELVLAVKVKPLELSQCRQELVKKHAIRAGTSATPRTGADALTPTSAKRLVRSKSALGLTSTDPDGMCADIRWPRQSCLEAMQNILKDCHETVLGIEEGLCFQQSSLEEFILTLRLAKPRYITSFSTLGDVINCYEYLLNSASIGKHVRTDLIQHFLSVVNGAKSSALSQMDQIISIVPHLVMYINVDCILQLKQRTAKFLLLTQPEHEFIKRQGNTAELVQLNVMDEALCGNLLGYLPYLLDEYRCFKSTVKDLLDALSLDDRNF